MFVWGNPGNKIQPHSFAQPANSVHPPHTGNYLLGTFLPAYDIGNDKQTIASNGARLKRTILQYYRFRADGSCEGDFIDTAVSLSRFALRQATEPPLFD